MAGEEGGPPPATLGAAGDEIPGFFANYGVTDAGVGAPAPAAAPPVPAVVPPAVDPRVAGDGGDSFAPSEGGASAGPWSCAPDGADGERSDGEESEDSDGFGSGRSEDSQADERQAVDALLTAAPAPSAAEAPDAPPPQPLTVPVAGYPESNLPVRTGLSMPMMPTPPSFIRVVPKEPEPIYAAPETLFDDIVRQEADRISRPETVLNRIVYDCLDTPEAPPDAPASPTHSPTGCGDLPAYYAPTGPDDATLVFESRFESGNLRRAVQVYEYEYDLILNPDYNTKSHTQWYHFRVGNTRRGPAYRFNILNMLKPTSVYNDGMRPLLYSSIQASVNGKGWIRCGENIAYYQNGVRRKEKGGSNYYTLTFTVTFEHDCDLVYFSHCYPYTYTDLQKDLRELEKDPNMSRRFRRRKLCETLAGNACDLITITSFCSDPSALRARRAIVLTARVHPGESNASWIMKGILDFLTGASLDARILRDNFIFKIVPMLNPDGVIVGNYRCSLAGQDLNRLWDDPSRKMHPTIFFTKSMMRHLLNDREVVLYIDLHGHSRKKNVFMYGNSESGSIREKIFPGLLCRDSECFNFDDCCFKVQKSKESTARVVTYRELSIVNAFTLEASFCGADFGPMADQHFTWRQLEEMGYMLCDAILDFCDPDQSTVNQVVRELQLLFPDDGNSDDVSDSEDDGAAAARARRRKGKKEKPKKAEKPSKREKADRAGRKAGPPGRADAADAAAPAASAAPWPDAGDLSPTAPRAAAPAAGSSAAAPAAASARKSDTGRGKKPPPPLPPRADSRPQNAEEAPADEEQAGGEQAAPQPRQKRSVSSGKKKPPKKEGAGPGSGRTVASKGGSAADGPPAGDAASSGAAQDGAASAWPPRSQSDELKPAAPQSRRQKN